jgi:hypothetical protein
VNSEEDGDSDCFDMVFDRCTKKEERDSRGACKARDDCDDQCKGKSGDYIPGSGYCECDDVRNTEDYCNKGCRDKAKKTILTKSGVVIITDPTIEDEDA